jgi:pentatricopeptide repeat protein
MVFREMKASGVVPDLGSYNTLLRSCANSGDIDRAKKILKEIQDPSNDLEATDRTWRAILRTAGKAKRSDLVLQTWKSAVAELGGTSDRDKTTDSSAPGTTSNKPTPSKKPKKKKSNSVTVETFRVFLTALLICAWDLRKSDHHTSVELYRIIIKCYNALRSSVSKGSNENSSMPANASAEESPSSSEAAVSPTSYMGLHMVDSNAAVQNPQIMASILQAVVNLESLLDKDDEWKTKLKQLGVAIAKTSCLGDSMQSSTEKRPSKPLSFFDKKALNTARSWY